MPVKSIAYTRFALLVIPSVALAIIAGCTVGPDYKKPNTTLPTQFSEISSATRPATQSTTQPVSDAAQPIDLNQWWKTFNDPALNRLIDRAVNNNLDLKVATARVYEARAQRGVQIAGLFPTASANGTYTRMRTSGSTLNGQQESESGFPLTIDDYNAGFDASWEIDVFGQQRRNIQAATADVHTAMEDRRDVLVSLLAEVALNYIELRGEQHTLEITNNNLASQRQTLNLLRSQFDAGAIPYLNVAQQEAEVATTQANLPTLEAQIRQNIHHLGTLLGVEPGALSYELTPPAPVPLGPGVIPPGLPGELLLRRPDVRRAEYQLAAATARIGVATADLYPKFAINGSAGLESDLMHRWFDWNSRYFTLGPSVQWEILDFGRIRSNIKASDARAQEAFFTYKKTVLQSLEDVDTTLVNYNREQVRWQALNQAVVSNQKAFSLADELYRKGATSYLQVLDVQRNLFAAQDALTRSQQQVSLNLVALYKALGGGWDVTPAAPKK